MHIWRQVTLPCACRCMSWHPGPGHAWSCWHPGHSWSWSSDHPFVDWSIQVFIPYSLSCQWYVFFFKCASMHVCMNMYFKNFHMGLHNLWEGCSLHADWRCCAVSGSGCSFGGGHSSCLALNRFTYTDLMRSNTHGIWQCTFEGK